jgi:uncharacterized tellurite resistance protein B-like protein
MINVRNLGIDQRKNHLRNLAVLAMKDGRLAPSEKQLLEVVAREWGLSQKDMSAIAANPDQAEFAIPDDREARFRIMYDFVEMMIIDGEMKLSEKQLCEAMTARLGFPLAAIRTIIDGILEGNRSLTDPDDIRESVRRKVMK